MKFTRIDAFEMNFEECSVARKYKLAGTTGMGEKRIYVGHDEQLLDDFFDLDNIECFILLKKDLQQYIIDAKEEFYNPVQDYNENLSDYYEENVNSTNNIPTNVIKIHFTKKYDSQNRYYLNFKNDKFSSSNWNFLRNIALPRVTKLNFVKLKSQTQKLYIYIKPVFYIDDKEKEEKIMTDELLNGNRKVVDNRRKGQAQWRINLLDIMPGCVITKVTEDRVLEACHIKPHSVSLSEGNDSELTDVNNGLIMTPTYHKLFDMGFISFKDNGVILISPFLSNMNKKRLNLFDNMQCKIPSGCAPYLAYHRANIYNQIPDLQI